VVPNKKQSDFGMARIKLTLLLFSEAALEMGIENELYRSLSFNHLSTCPQGGRLP
jgi:hypothetical protein